MEEVRSIGYSLIERKQDEGALHLWLEEDYRYASQYLIAQGIHRSKPATLAIASDLKHMSRPRHATVGSLLFRPPFLHIEQVSPPLLDTLIWEGRVIAHIEAEVRWCVYDGFGFVS
ncbi:hypothetical protein L1987_25415 [Smallanthus sonchifolius]|uniref:Uncharacterized protein n=1 Tax=Smallanthus sonchifolius TaxID=185202 RepID=A0ACB9IQU7_9ASTR|nr:hypothetical protein L1987_25415 [Smallanthus sonchifolius]